MKIQKLFVSGVRGLPDRTFDLVSPRTGRAADLVFVTGPTGSGKTSFLEAIIGGKEAIAPYGPMREPKSFLRRGESSAKVRIDWTLSAAELDRVGGAKESVASEAIFTDNPTTFPASNDPGLIAVLSDYERTPDVGKVEYFHANRRLAGMGARSIAAASSDTMDRMIRLTREDAKYALLQGWLMEAAVGLERSDGPNREPGRARFDKALAKVCATKTFAGAGRVEDGVEVRFAGRDGGAVALGALADGEKMAVLFAASFCRAEIHNSIVLVDTPELHIPSDEVKGFMTGLTELGVGNQLIVATGSREALEADPGAPVIRLGAAGSPALPRRN